MKDMRRMGALLRGMKPEMLADGGMPDAGAGAADDGAPGGDDAPLTMASQDLVAAIHSKDIEGVKAALTAAFMYLDSQEHEEGPAPEEGAAPPMPGT